MTAQNADVPPSDSESPPRPPGAQSGPPLPVDSAPPAQPPRQVPPGPRPATGSAAVPAPPAPAVSPGAPEPAAAEQPRRRSAGVLLATTVAVLALAVAVAAVLVAWRALGRAAEARDIATAAGTRAAPSPPPGATTGPTLATATEAGPTATTPVDPDSTPQEPVLTEQTRYEVAYANEPLTIEATGCQDMNVDLDAPQLRVSPEEFEINFNAACYSQPAHLTFAENVRASRVEGAPELTPIECGKRVQTGVLGPNAQVPVRQGTVLCVRTSLAAATQSGIRQKMVVVKITGVAKDGTVTAEASAWNIPR